ncbi:MAG TPA: exosortase-associated EpsI family protein [Kiritimatiellia bacterium]|mgnify:CR=1 FL=1|nr:exosortase-associated EpsI family protein [Kiritimatiellia bacterium]
MKPAVALFIAGLLMLATLAAMPKLTRVDFVDRPSIHTRLPAQAGAWTGHRVFHCQLPAHANLILFEDQLAGDGSCPDCGGPVSSLSPVERQLLPADTRIDKMFYTKSPGREHGLMVALVFSGRDRSSIHRPEVCLVGEGSEIVRSARHTVNRGGAPLLPVALLDVQRTARIDANRIVSIQTFFAYWFMGSGHVTASHTTRMFWMGLERIRGKAYPWAYISVAGTYGPDRAATVRELDELVAILYDLLPLPTFEQP